MEAPISRERGKLRWWATRVGTVHQLEHPSLEADKSLRRLRYREMERAPVVRSLYADVDGAFPWDLAAWEATATGRFGIYRLVAAFPEPPEERPRVFCLDGPYVPEHRYSRYELCLYYPQDPIERRWTRDQGLLGLFDMARAHVAAEELVATEGGPWALDEAPHGPTKPAPSDPSLKLAPLGARL